MIHKIKKLISWIPVIWQDEDFDFDYIYKILHKKFTQMEKYHRKHGHYVKSEKTANQLRLVKNLCKRLSECDYLNNATTIYYKKYKESNFFDCFKYDLNGWTYVGDPNKYRREDFSRCSEHAEYMEEQDKKYLFDCMKKYIDEWWN